MEHYKLVITIGDYSVEISSHEKKWVEDKEIEYRNLLSIPKDKQRKGIPAGESRLKEEKIHKTPQLGKMPVNEFYRKYIHETKVRSRPDIVTFFIYYLTRIQGNEDVTSTDVKNCFKSARYPGWNKINIGDVLNKAKAKAFLNSVGNQWSLTITGEDFVLNSLSK